VLRWAWQNMSKHKTRVQLHAFDSRKSVYINLTLFLRTLASSGKELKSSFLRALAQREEGNRSGKMTVSTAATFKLRSIPPCIDAHVELRRGLIWLKKNGFICA